MNENKTGRHKGKTAKRNVAVPSSMLHTLSEVALGFEAFQGELEDYLLSHDPAFLEQMCQARASPGGQNPAA